MQSGSAVVTNSPNPRSHGCWPDHYWFRLVRCWHEAWGRGETTIITFSVHALRRYPHSAAFVRVTSVSAIAADIAFWAEGVEDT